MMSLETIRDLSREQAQRAAKLHKIPFLFEEEDRNINGIRNIPNLGDYRPAGWELVKEYFVDKTGVGAPGEPALTVEQFLATLKVGFGYAVIEEGQFQIFVGEFKKIK